MAAPDKDLAQLCNFLESCGLESTLETFQEHGIKTLAELRALSDEDKAKLLKPVQRKKLDRQLGAAGRPPAALAKDGSFALRRPFWEEQALKFFEAGDSEGLKEMSAEMFQGMADGQSKVSKEIVKQHLLSEFGFPEDPAILDSGKPEQQLREMERGVAAELDGLLAKADHDGDGLLDAADFLEVRLRVLELMASMRAEQLKSESLDLQEGFDMRSDYFREMRVLMMEDLSRKFGEIRGDSESSYVSFDQCFAMMENDGEVPPGAEVEFRDLMNKLWDLVPKEGADATVDIEGFVEWRLRIAHQLDLEFAPDE